MTYQIYNPTLKVYYSLWGKKRLYTNFHEASNASKLFNESPVSGGTWLVQETQEPILEPME